MSDACSPDSVRAVLMDLAERVMAKTAWPEWHMETALSSRVHGTELCRRCESRVGLVQRVS